MCDLGKVTVVVGQHLLEHDGCRGVVGSRDEMKAEKLDCTVAYFLELILDLCCEGGGNRPPLAAGPVRIVVRRQLHGMLGRVSRPRPPGVS